MQARASARSFAERPFEPPTIAGTVYYSMPSSVCIMQMETISIKLWYLFLGTSSEKHRAGGRSGTATSGGGMPHWIRVRHGGHERFGLLEGESIRLHAGSLLGE